MKSRTIVGLVSLVCLVCGSSPNAAQRVPTVCDRECLRGKVTQLLYALLKHDVSGLPVADTLRVTEDAVERPLAKVGLVGTVTRLRGFRQDIIDERAGVAGANVVVEETGAPVLLVVRLKVVADKVTEIELVATRSRPEGLIFNIDGLSAPSGVMNYAPRPEQLATCDAAIKAALHYPEGLNAAKTFAAVNAPFAPDAYRYENGQVMAGPDCKFAPGCQNISTQSLAIFQRLGDVQTRVIATSTLRPSSSCRSCSRAITSSSVRPAWTSTRRSMSLSGRSSPRATEPNTRTFLTPWRTARSRISRRRRTSDSSAMDLNDRSRPSHSQRTEPRAACYVAEPGLPTSLDISTGWGEYAHI